MSDNEKRDERSDAARAADDAERERFEAWAGPHGYNLTKFDGQYAYQNTHDAREGWQAALSARADGGKGEAVAWLHTMYMEGDQTDDRLSFSEENPWGEPGANYSEEYAVVSKPLYTAPQAGCAPREAQPYAWLGNGGYYTRNPEIAANLPSMMPVYAAPTPERADADTAGANQPVGSIRSVPYWHFVPLIDWTAIGDGAELYVRAAGASERADAAPNPSNKKEPVARYPHAAIGEALISSGIYDRMNDITGGDRQARMLIQELIEKVDPVLDRWHATVVAAAGASERADAEKDAARLDWLEQEDEMGFFFNLDHISANINEGFNGFKTLREAIDAAILAAKEKKS
jgi:hypothetical protein